jgi:hypothetical protein
MTNYALRVARPWAANRPAGCWPATGRIIMTSYRPPNHYPFSVPLIIEFNASANAMKMLWSNCYKNEKKEMLNNL